MGTLAVDDGRGKDWYASFGAATKVTTIEPLIRLAVQQSNCFVITSIGNNKTESKISAITDKQRNSGEFRAGSKQQKGQRVAADYYLEPAIIIDNASTGKMAGALGGLVGGGFGAIAGLAGDEVLRRHDDAVRHSLVRADRHLGRQLHRHELRRGTRCFRRRRSRGLDRFSQTPEGKASVAAFIDAYNSMVISLRNYKAQEVKGGLGRGGALKVN